jgi:GNAT superfamily N-acetyltransferase
MTEIVFERHSGGQTLAMLDTIADLYTAIHSEDPRESGGIFSRPSFMARTRMQALDAGFGLITAVADDTLAGFSFGYPFPRGRWWADSTPPDPDVLNSAKFAVIELDVEKTYRGQGLAKKLLGNLLANRAEEFATLAAIPDTQAWAMYLRWGWHKAAMLGGEGPAMDALLLPLGGP